MNGDSAIYFRFIIAALATWRLAFLVARERGPARVFLRLRHALGTRSIAGAVACVKCAGLWIAIPFAFFVRAELPDVVVIWLALAGVTAVIDEWTRSPFEWQESRDEGRHDAPPGDDRVPEMTTRPAAR